MGKYIISKKDMLEILSERDADVTDDTEITAVTLTDDGVEVSFEEKEKEEASEG